MKYGELKLIREKKNYTAGFCMLKKELSELTEYFPLLHPDEKTYYESIKVDRRKISYLLGRVAAKEAISILNPNNELQSIFIDYGIFNFPVVKSLSHSNIQVSITHCEHIGIALAFPEEHPLGIDIEKIDETKTDSIKTQISANEIELALNNTITLPAGCTLIWTIKEALSKIFKTGLTMEFKILEVESIKKTGDIYTSTFLNFAQYKAISCISKAYVCSIIVPKKTTIDLEMFWNNFTNL